MTLAGARELLETGAMRLLGLMPRASNFTFLAEVSGDVGTVLCVYKPRDGETPLWDFPDGTLHRREVAASVLATHLGWPSIPVTVLRDGPHGPGSVQLFVDADPNEHYFTLRDTRLDAFRPAAAFDVIANNADRKSGHCLLDAQGEIWFVDHGVCFAAAPKLRTVIWDFVGDPLPADLCSGVADLGDELASGPLRDQLTRLLSTEEVDAAAGRAWALARSGRYPAPTSDRAYPWPPV